MANYIGNDDAQRRLKDNFDRLYALPDDQCDLDADLTAACAEVNASVGKRYDVPVTSPEALSWLKTLALDLFCARAWTRGVGDELPKKVTEAASLAREQLAAIAAGKTKVGGAVALTEATAGAGAILVAGPAPEFTREQMEGF